MWMTIFIISLTILGGIGIGAYSLTYAPEQTTTVALLLSEVRRSMLLSMGLVNITVTKDELIQFTKLKWENFEFSVCNNGKNGVVFNSTENIVVCKDTACYKVEGRYAEKFGNKDLAPECISVDKQGDTIYDVPCLLENCKTLMSFNILNGTVRDYR